MRLRALFLGLVLVCSAAATPADAQNRNRGFEPNWVSPAQGQRPDNREHEIRPLREVVNELRAQYGGEYIAHRLEDGARPIYVIRWRMPDGQVRDFRVYAAR
jgi:hypothetical protein